MTWCGRTCCTRASCVSRVAVRSLPSLDEAALRRAERGEFRIVRVGDFVAFVGADETVVQRAAAAAPVHAKWDNVRQITPEQQEAAWLVGQPSQRSRAGAPTARGRDSECGDRELFAALRRACLDGAVLRAGGIPQRASVGVVAHPGRLSAAHRAGECAGAFAGRDHRAACARRRLLWPQRRRRCRGGCRGDRDANPRPLHPRAMAPRRGVRLRTVRPGDARHAACGAGRCGKTRGLDCGNLVGDACAAAEHRRQPADARGAADTAAGSATDRSAGGQRRRRHAQCVSAVRLRGEARGASSGAARAGAHVGAARSRRAAQRVRDRVLHGRTGRTCRRRSGGVPVVDAVRSARAPRDREHRAALQLVGARAGGQRARARAWAGRATRTRPPMPPSRWRWRSIRRCGCAVSGAPPMRDW